MQFPKEAMKPLVVVFLFVWALVLSGCGGHSVPTLQITQPGPPAFLTIAVSPSSVLPGQSATITWSSQNATSCTASGAWSGTEPMSGSVNVQLQSPSEQSYTLVCTGTGMSASRTITLGLSPVEGACTPTSAARSRRVVTSRAIAAARRAVATGTAGPKKSAVAQ